MKSIKRVVHLNQKDNQESDIASQDCQTEPTNQMCSSSQQGKASKPARSSPLQHNLAIPQVLSTLGLLTFWAEEFFVVRGCPVHWRMLCSFPDLYPLDAYPQF